MWKILFALTGTVQRAAILGDFGLLEQCIFPSLLVQSMPLWLVLPLTLLPKLPHAVSNIFEGWLEV